MPLDIHSLLSLSTAHLSAETCRQMDVWCETIDLGRREFSKAPTLMGATDYGWFCYCRDERDDSLEIPDDLWACMEFARGKGASYLLFDADADELDELPNLGGPDGLSQPA